MKDLSREQKEHERATSKLKSDFEHSVLKLQAELDAKEASFQETVRLLGI